jgi:hypothetical protein
MAFRRAITDVPSTGTPQPVSPSPAQPQAQAVWEQTERILASSLFQSSQRYTNLLKFIVDRTLKGETKDLKERIIGIEVFGRTPDYDTSIDPTVRVAVNEIRKRLAQYYAKPEHQQELRVDVPVGSYLAEFKIVDVVQTELKPGDRTATARRTNRWFLWAAAAAAVIALAVWTVSRLLFPVSAIDRLWAPVLKTSGPVLICIGSPLDSSTSSGSSSPEAPTSSDELVKVGMMDTNAARDLAAYLRQKGKESEVRPTQGTKLIESQADSVILIGRYLNEWAAQIGTDLHYRIHSDSKLGLRWIEDISSPQDKTWSVAYPASDAQIDHDYALITRIQDKTNGRWWVGIAGLTGLGTLAANRLVIDPVAMSNIAASLPAGWDRKNVQIVLEVKLVQGNPGVTRIIKTSTW